MRAPAGGQAGCSEYVSEAAKGISVAFQDIRAISGPCECESVTESQEEAYVVVRRGVATSARQEMIKAWGSTLPETD